MTKKNLLFVLFTFFISTNALAYLDPGSGSALISLILVLIGSLTFILKSIWFKVKNIFYRTKNEEYSNKENVVIFSEGRNYYTTFIPIINEFISKKYKIFYATLDLHDPILMIDNHFFDGIYLGSGKWGFARFERIHASIMISTTPNIGAPGYPIKRPKGVRHLVFIGHAIGGLTNFRKYSLDQYDTILMPGKFMEMEVRQTESLRQLKPKLCIPVGLPYLDKLKFDIEKQNYQHSSDKILIAPSWGSKNFLNYTGINFIKKIIDSGHSVLFRPHPQSWISEGPLLNEILQTFKNCPKFEIDKNGNLSDSFAQCKLLISGKSAVRFDYAFLFNRTVVSIKIPFLIENEYEFSLIGNEWEELLESRIGPVVDASDVDFKIEKIIADALEMNSNDNVVVAEIANIGISSQKIVEWCQSQLRNYI